MDACYCDGDRPSVYVATMQVARKQHDCYECRAMIQPSEQYERVFAVYDGRGDSFKTCQRCLDLRDWVKAHVPCFCWYHGNMRCDAIETAANYASEAPGFMFGTYRRAVKILQRQQERRIKHAHIINTKAATIESTTGASQ